MEAGQLVINAGDDEIVLDQVGLVLRKVRLEGPSTESCPEESEGDSGCGELEFGPVLFELPLEEGAEGVLNAMVPVGSYTGLKFQLHRPTNANEDADFVAEHPDYDDISIRVVGSLQRHALHLRVRSHRGGEPGLRGSAWMSRRRGSAAPDTAGAGGGLVRE